MITTEGTKSRRLLEPLVAILLFIAGALYLLPGAYLLMVGGSPYYVAAGVALIASGVLLWHGCALAYGLYLILFVATLVWAFAESGLDGWALLPRLDVLAVGGLFMLVGWFRRGTPKPVQRSVASGAVAALIVAGLGFGWSLNDRAAIATQAQIAAPPPATGEGDWIAIGHSNAAERFSPLAQITPANVGKLEPLWTARIGMPPKGMVGALEATPLKIGDTLYTCGMTNDVVALDAETGAIRWHYDPKMDRVGVVMAMCRGVTYVPAAQNDGCGPRIVMLTHDTRMIAVRTTDGKPCESFGVKGEVDLKQGMGPVPRGYLYYTSPAILVRGKLVLGSSVLDGQMADEPSGVIRAYDAATGAFAWAWDMGRPGQTGMPGPGEMFTRGTPNAWPPLTADDALGAVYVPLGNATPDYVAAHRSPIMNQYGSSIVALDADTGALRWYFQTTHRDVWDYDNASPPTLTDFPTREGLRQAVIVPTKRGVFFVLDRRTGRPLVETVERPVPQDPVPGEQLSPTQPYPVGMPSFTGDRLTEAKMWGLTPFDQMWCRIRFRESRYDGDFTPLGIKPSIVYPGYYGGSEWGGVSVDPMRRIMVLNVMHLPLRNRLIPRPAADPKLYRPFDAEHAPMDIKHWDQKGTRYAAKTGAFVSPLNVPCTQPPFSEVAAVDLITRRVLWRKPLGTGRESGPLGLKSGLPLAMGVPAVGASMVTKSGLMFIAAAQDRTLRAFDTRSGTLLWEARLPAAGHANPMTYWSVKSGRQIVLVPASGHPQLEDGVGDYLVAYALPRAKG
ncbi:membrane-bound PQQ-dependent dehydrogenase, glucose/quinate/shikimate family [Flavisphingomonas formosensis]|uniref:membrane-bound PQQ-dependent dehydrogenase, glucose/quinate/shikimate family n=1 Tax=Flavisphingomonas formosensis TaxID=861534 RepID=UPI0012F764C6|nr:membrane-bound PQQ-dependent dehydrogenase, glucose/quinate/shikimate family [Sphingomonas formosensis]